MSLLISHMTALDFWRMAYPCGKSPSIADCSIPNSAPAFSEEDVWVFAPSAITPEILLPERNVLHVTVRNANNRYRSNTHHCHLWGNTFPSDSFYRLSKDAFVASPQFLFLQMARGLSLTQLIALGNELCGYYTIDGRSETGVRQRQLPLISKQALACHLEEAATCAKARNEPAPQGMQKALRALPYIVEHSASPKETEMAMLLSLPYRLGGYGIPQPSMNHRIELTEEAARMARRHSVRADLCWPDHSLDLEFNGAAVHSGGKSETSDRARTNALMLMGYSVIEVTSQQIADHRAFESIALHVAKLIKKRVAPKYRGPLPQRIRLRECLNAWSRMQGRA